VAVGPLICFAAYIGLLESHSDDMFRIVEQLLNLIVTCHTRIWKANRMQTMYVSGSETHVHSDYIIGHHHTMLKINSGNIFYYIKMSMTSIESNT
jgi:hypothetical protein